MKDNYSAWRVDPADYFKLRDDNERLKFLLKFGVLAPSSHNSQPWSFGVTESLILIHKNESRSLPASDVNCRQLYISLGCALENLIVAADYYGISAEVSYFGNLKDLIEVSFKFNRPIQFRLNDRLKHLIHSISERRTNRNKYEDTMPDDGFWSNSVVRVISLDVRSNFVTVKKNKDAIADAVLDAMSVAMADDKFRLELSEYVKSNYTSSGLGMPGFGMGISGPISVLIPTIIRKFNMYKLTRKQDEALLKDYTPMFGILSTHGDDPTSWIKAGQAYQRIALEAERAGLKTAVMAAAIQIGDYYKVLQKVLGISERPQVFFRIGYCEKNVHPSPRISLL